MELKHYLRVIRRQWKTVAAVAIISMLLTALFVSRQGESYEATGSYVVRPRILESDEIVRATDALNRGVEINSTYARIARSDLIKDRAKDALQADDVPTSGLGARSEVVPGTNILEIGASGADPEAVAAYADELGAQTIAYLEEINEVFQLQLLDPPGVPEEPVATSNTLTIVLGVLMGFATGAVLAFFVEYLGEGGHEEGLHRIYDQGTGVYSADFLRLRFRQEMSRCNLPSSTKARWRVGTHSFTLGLVKLNANANGSQNGSAPAFQNADRRSAAQALQTELRFEDVLAYVGDNTFAVLLPDMPTDVAELLLEEWGERIGSPQWNGRHGGPSIDVSMGLCRCGSNGLQGDEETVRYARDLQSDAG